jgi:hypothetical protein
MQTDLEAATDAAWAALTKPDPPTTGALPPTRGVFARLLGVFRRE